MYAAMEKLLHLVPGGLALGSRSAISSGDASAR